MTLDPITRLNAALEGRYRIEREIGEGGMATVYLAEDLRHERKVALKVLKPELAAVVGAERFLAEIKTTANLQHPHILPLFDSGQADGFLYFVMPYVEGDTLRDKIDREKQLSVDEALKITEKVASALDYAHKQGVVHRDIKPGNILLSSTGEPTVADFGIALAVAQAGGGRVTETGLSVGTPHYMSPEQATGDRDVDPRADVYALGCVLYEMLVGQPPYTGVSAQAVLAQILTDPPPTPTKVRVSIPPNVDAAIRKALEKLPADRFASAQDLSNALEDSGFRHGDEAAARMVANGGPWKGLSIVTSAVAIIFATGFGWLLLRPEQAQPPQPVSRQVISALPAAPVVTTQDRPDVAISADGQNIVYQASTQPPGALVVRPLNRLESVSQLPGGGPFLSPDGQWIGFQDIATGPLQRVSILGGPPQTLAQLPAPLRGASWGPDDTIVYGLNQTGGLWQVPAAGGEPRPLTTPATGEGRHQFPDVLPGGTGVLFTINSLPALGEEQIAVLDMSTREHRVIIPSGSSPRYAASGHIVYAADGTLWAAAFDPERLEVTSDPVPMVEGVMVKGSGAASFDLSENGSLVYVSGSAAGGGQRTAVWVDRDGSEEALPLPPRIYDSPRLSPDGTRLAMGVTEADGSNPLWVFDVVSAAGLRLTQEGVTNTPVWTGDGRIAFNTSPGVNAIYTVAADGSGAPELLLPGVEGTTGDYPTSVTPDGQQLIFSRLLTAEHREIVQVPLQGEPVAQPILQGDFNRGNAEVSPDGRWLVYRSDQSGQMEVYVQPYPGPGPTVPVSIGGGTSVTWSPDGTELIYRLDDRMMAVSFTVEGDTPRIGPPTELFRGDYYTPVLGGTRGYHIAPDGRFLMLKAVTNETAAGDQLPSQVILVQNFFEELREVMPD